MDAIGDDQIDRRIEVEDQQDAALPRAHKAERARILHHFADAFHPPFQFPARHEISKSPNDLAGADRLFRRLVEAGFDLGGVDSRAGGQEPTRAFHVIADCRERLIEFMRKRRSHLPHRAQPRHMQQLGMQFLESDLQFLQRRVGFGGRGDVASDNRGPDECACNVEDRRDGQRDMKNRSVAMPAQCLVMVDALASLYPAENVDHVVAATGKGQARDRLSDEFSSSRSRIRARRLCFRSSRRRRDRC